ncbi:MAG: class II aldolase/adducin family protein [Phycisphaerae bacterium]
MTASNLPERLLPAFRRAGETLLACRCNNSHSGNLSVRCGDDVVITRTGAMLGTLASDDLVVVPLERAGAERRDASSELPVHLAVYARTPHTAVAHGHALWAVLAGWLTDEVVPIDVEGAYYYARIPVVECVPATASPVTGQAVAAALADTPVVIVRGHGVFAAGESLERAMQRITSVDNSARLYVEARRAGLDVRALAQRPYLDFGGRGSGGTDR